MAEKIRSRAIITGRVQGVFFRAETQQAARRFGVTGWVRNRPDGSVEAVFEGDPEAVENTVNWCRQGPPHSRVEAVMVNPEKYIGEFHNFDIRY
jgi:acylphosphatase